MEGGKGEERGERIIRSTSQCEHPEANVQRGQEDEVLVIYALQDESVPTCGPRHSGPSGAGPGHMVGAKSAGLTCSFLFQPLPSTLGRLPPLRQCHQSGLDQ